MNIVVTGALGHIGSSLIRALPAHFPDADIVMIDNMITQRYASLFDLPTIGRYRFIEADIRPRTCARSSRAPIRSSISRRLPTRRGASAMRRPLRPTTYNATAAVAAACIETGSAANPPLFRRASTARRIRRYRKIVRPMSSSRKALTRRRS